MNKKPEQRGDHTPRDHKPPFFTSWKRIYILVLAILMMLISLFYLLTIQYS